MTGSSAPSPEADLRPRPSTTDSSVTSLAEAELRIVTSLSPSDGALLLLSCRHLATLVTDLRPPLPHRPLPSLSIDGEIVSNISPQSRATR